MLKNLISLSALSLTMWGAAVAAQEADTSDEAPADEQVQGIAGGLDLGRPVDTGVQVGQRYSKEKFGDWDMACIKAPEGEDPCSMLQILNGPQGSPMAEVTLFRLPEGQVAFAGATIIVPLETLLTAPLTISIDGGPAKRYNYSFCNPVGCIAQVGLTEADIDAMKKGTKATVSLVPAPAPDQTINLDISLKGFTAGFDAAKVVNTASQ